jgi:hypothetical protein
VRDVPAPAHRRGERTALPELGAAPRRSLGALRPGMARRYRRPSGSAGAKPVASPSRAGLRRRRRRGGVLAIHAARHHRPRTGRSASPSTCNVRRGCSDRRER